jgi:mutator protein MutT
MKKHPLKIAAFLIFLQSAVFSHPVFLEEPEMFSPQLEVAGCVCRWDQKILLLKRNPQKPQGGAWCVPGGKLEKGETPRDAIVREVKEEIGVDLKGRKPSYFGKVFVRFPDVDFILHLFLCEFDEKPALWVAPEEHEDFCWVTFDEAKKLPLIPGGQKCLQLVLKNRC